ncbi:MAG: xanthine dehydrogenase family protein molybdopterin-binding subunit [Pseudomonadota bacterium]|nr:xanthine dehydrogenase family protein molybdopterin-binding subunit [Pseudomonadota bacterium]
MLHYLEQPLRLAAATAMSDTSRRSFLKATGGIGVGLVIGFAVPGLAGPARAATGAGAGGALTPFVRIAPDGTVTVISKHLDKGQGTATGLATLVAEELDAKIESVRVEFAPANAELYKNLLFGVQGTGGSTAMANSFQQYRTAGAAARAMLRQAAATAWGVPVDEVKAADGMLSHASGKSAGYGEMAAAASALSPPEAPALKQPSEWRYIGKSFPRVDVPMKTQGATGAFGLDVDIPGRIVAVLARAPKFGATVKSVKAEAAKAVRDVIDVRPSPAGVIVFAKSTWPAIKARDLLEIEWDYSSAETRGTAELLAEYRDLAGKPGPVARDADADAALAGAKHVVELEYSFPYLAHAPMETLDVTIRFDGAKATIWTGSQLQTVDQMVAGAVLGVGPQDIAIETSWAGGSFGRRAVPNSDYIAEACIVAKVWGQPDPVKVIWTREDDLRGGYYRPMYVHRVRAGVGADGRIVGWMHRVVGQSIFTGTAFEKFVVHNGIDHASVEGAVDTPYSIPGMRVELHTPKVGVPVLWWRSVGHTHTAYVMETMMDALASASGQDPVAFRLAHLDGDARKAGVLRLAAEKAGWGSPLPAGRSRGIAVHKSFSSYVAEVAEVSIGDGGAVKVERVVAAVDCGVPINPDNIRAQIEGGIGYGLGAILRNAITLTDGVVDQSNFDTYESLRIDDMPTVEVHIVPSTEAPTGVGEPGTPPIGPAVANAVFAAKGSMPVNLPFTTEGHA